MTFKDINIEELSSPQVELPICRRARSFPAALITISTACQTIARQAFSVSRMWLKEVTNGYETPVGTDQEELATAFLQDQG